jgi:hypothetical protein
MAIIAGGIGALAGGAFEYRNWWGGVVFAPVAILIGAAVLFIVLFRPAALDDTEKRPSRIRGWPTRHKH